MHAENLEVIFKGDYFNKVLVEFMKEATKPFNQITTIFQIFSSLTLLWVTTGRKLAVLKDWF